MPHRRVRTPVEQLQPFELGRIVDLREAGWTYRRIVAHVGHNIVVCRCFQQWSVEHSHTRRLLEVLDARAVQTRVKIDVLCEQRWPSEPSREEIRAHVVPALSPSTLWNSLLAARLGSSSPLARLPQHCQARLLWCRESID